jgi:hypothetical protein
VIDKRLHSSASGNCGIVRITVNAALAAEGLTLRHGRRVTPGDRVAPHEWAAAAAAASWATGIFLMSECAPENGSPAVLLMTLLASTR